MELRFIGDGRPTVYVQVILLLFLPHVYFFRDSERKNAPRKIPL